MARIVMKGHEETAATGDMLRLFFGHVRPEDGVFCVASARAFDLTVATEPAVSAEAVRAAVRTGEGASRSVRLVVDTVTDAGTAHREERVALGDLRRDLRRLLYLALSEVTGLVFPWGTLTGVRPTQVAAAELAAHGRAKAKTRLTDYWRVSEAKATLALDTAAAECRRMAEIDTAGGDYLVYVGLPFCPSRCAYCSFISRDAASQADHLAGYVEAVIAEAQGLFRDVVRPARAVYVGGGTPTSLPPDLFKHWLEGVMAAVPHDGETELTLEAGRPDTIDRDKLTVARALGFQHLCINPQTMFDATLRAIGRRHRVADVLCALALAREAGFRSINMDLIAGLPGDVPDGFNRSLERVLQLDPEHITLHTLSIKRGAFWNEDRRGRRPFLPDPELSEAMERAHARLRAAGYRPYYLYRQKTIRAGLENTGFSRGRGSLYNVAMMSDLVPVVGLGSGASSKMIVDGTAVRRHNPKDLLVYMEREATNTPAKRAYMAAAGFYD